jgi:hypothetical protein
MISIDFLDSMGYLFILVHLLMLCLAMSNFGVVNTFNLYCNFVNFIFKILYIIFRILKYLIGILISDLKME